MFRHLYYVTYEFGLTWRVMWCVLFTLLYSLALDSFAWLAFMPAIAFAYLLNGIFKVVGISKGQLHYCKSDAWEKVLNDFCVLLLLIGVPFFVASIYPILKGV